jgi:hypothetical protein
MLAGIEPWDPVALGITTGRTAPRLFSGGLVSSAARSFR